MRYDLVIDGKRADMGESTINLTYRNSLFESLENIKGSFSYTIKIPKTNKNLNIIQCADVASNQNGFVYTSHRAELYKDGIRVAGNASLYIQKIDQYIHLNLAWGAGNAIKRLVDINRKLSDYDFGTISWEYDKTSDRVPYSRCYSDSNYGGTAERLSQPVVYISEILEKIRQDHGIVFELPQLEDWNNIAILCTKGDVEVEKFEDQKTLISYAGTYTSDFNRPLQFTRDDIKIHPNIKFVPREDTESESDAWYCIAFSPRYEVCSVWMKGEITIEIYKNDNIALEKLYLQDNRETFRIDYKSVKDSGGWFIYYFEIDMELPALPYLPWHEMELLVKRDGTDSSPYYTTMKFIGDVELTPAITSLYPVIPSRDVPMNMNLSKNLPELSLKDIIKSMMVLYGLYAEETGDDKVVKLIRHEKIEENIPIAIDWSDKMYNKSMVASSIEYTDKKFAQKMYLRYLEDEGERKWDGYEGYIMVDNATIAKEKELGRMPFAYSPDYPGLCHVKQEDGNNSVRAVYDVQFRDIKPRICLVKNQAVQRKALRMDDVVSNYYGFYQRIVEHPKIITEDVRLSPVDLKNLDFSIPVYIRQFGGYFVILEIKVGEDDLCKVKLLKI